MSRRHAANKRVINPDPIYNSKVITKFTNQLMRQGKKSVAERVVYDALSIINRKTKQDSLEVFNAAIKNVMPALQVRSRRVGGATYQVPVEVPHDRALALSIRWLIDAARSKRGEKTMEDKLAVVLIDAFNGVGEAIKKKIDTHKMAEANKAFSHYRW